MNISFIPVRCGSKSIPLKNIKLFCGEPLIYWNLRSLQNSALIDKIIVATDCMEIKSVVNDFKFSKVEVYDREATNSRDQSSTESVMIEYINKSNLNNDDLFILAQATSPLTQSEDFDGAITKLINEKADSLLTCVRTKRFFWDEAATPINYDYQSRPRRQDFKGTLLENGAFYISYVKNILASENRLSKRIAIYEMPEFTAVEIDEEDDWMIAEKLMMKHILPSASQANKKIKLFLSDVDGTLTDAGMYYGNNGEELKKFNTHDGKGFELLKANGIKTGLITSESTRIVTARAEKMKVDYLYQGKEFSGKLEVAREICEMENISMDEVAYIGDDINCKELLECVGTSACPSNAVSEILKIANIIKLTKPGGDGAVREFIESLI